MGTQLTFKKTETAFEGLKIVRYKDLSGKFEINASRQGVYISGESPILRTKEQLDTFAECVARAWQHYQAMRGINGIPVE